MKNVRFTNHASAHPIRICPIDSVHWSASGIGGAMPYMKDKSVI